MSTLNSSKSERLWNEYGLLLLEQDRKEEKKWWIERNWNTVLGISLLLFSGGALLGSGGFFLILGFVGLFFLMTNRDRFS